MRCVPAPSRTITSPDALSLWTVVYVVTPPFSYRLGRYLEARHSLLEAAKADTWSRLEDVELPARFLVEVHH